MQIVPELIIRIVFLRTEVDGDDFFVEPFYRFGECKLHLDGFAFPVVVCSRRGGVIVVGGIRDTIPSAI